MANNNPHAARPHNDRPIPGHRRCLSRPDVEHPLNDVAPWTPRTVVIAWSRWSFEHLTVDPREA